MDDRKREEVIAAAIEVFAVKGFEQAKVHDISEKAGIGTGVLYSRSLFINKLDILLSIVLSFWESLNKRVDEIKEEKIDPKTKLFSILDALEQLLLKDNPSVYLFKVVNESLPYMYFIKEKELAGKRKAITVANRQLLNSLDSIIQEGQDQGQFDKALKPSVWRQVLYGSFQLLMYGLFLKISNINEEEKIDYDEKDIRDAMHLLLEKFVSAHETTPT
jgi:TetR/AcrR family transcriptional regulator, fatty acid metabolism regulator protein